jgi:signal peptidase I
MGRLVSTSAAIAALAAIALAWATFAPSALGGTKTYLVIEGTSMQPALTAGDLVIVRNTGDRRLNVGEVAAYREGTGSSVFLHRVIDATGGVYTFKGDNNSWTDSSRPTQEDIVGAAWLRVPMAGSLATWLARPLHASAGAGLVVFLGLTLVPSRRKKKMTAISHHRPSLAPFQGTVGLQFWAYGPAGRSLLTAVTVAAIALTATAFLLFNLPQTRATTVGIPYEMRGQVTYGATGQPESIYDGGIVRTGDPIYVNITRSIDVTFDFTVSAAVPLDVKGTITPSLQLGDVNGWTRHLDGEPVPFSGSETQLSVPADLNQAMALLISLQSVAPSQSYYYTAEATFDVSITGTLDGRPFQDKYALVQPFRMRPPYEVYIETPESRLFETTGEVPSPGSQDIHDRPFIQATTRELPVPAQTERTFSALGASLSVSDARAIALLGALGAFVAIFVLGSLFYLGSRQSEVDRIDALYGNVMLRVTSPLRARPSDITVVDSMEALVYLADRYDRPVMRQAYEGAACYVVEEAGTTYCYMPAPVLDRHGGGL